MIISLILATTLAYEMHRYFTDPGLKIINEAELITDVNFIAVPTLLSRNEREGNGICTGSISWNSEMVFECRS